MLGSNTYDFDMAVLKSIHDFNFSVWIGENMGTSYTWDDFLKYLDYTSKREAYLKEQFEKKKQEYQSRVFSFTKKPEETERTKENADNANTGKSLRTINAEKLKDYFSANFKGMGNGNINYFESMIEELKTDRTVKEFAQIAYMIYQGNQMNDRKPNTFAGWYKIFCENIGIEQGKGYKPNNLKNPSDAIRKLFNYL